MTELQKWYKTFEENHKDDPIYIEVANSIDLEIRNNVKENEDNYEHDKMQDR